MPQKTRKAAAESEQASKGFEPASAAEPPSQAGAYLAPTRVISSGVGAESKFPPLIRKGHTFLFAWTSMSPREQDMVGLLYTRMRIEHAEGGEAQLQRVPAYRFSSEELQQWFDLDTKHLYSTLEPVADRLKGRSITQRDGRDRFRFINLFQSVEYADGSLTIHPTEAAWPIMLDESKGFAMINHVAMRELSGEYAKRLYEILSRFKTDDFQQYTLKIQDAMGIMGVLDKDGNPQNKTFQSAGLFISRTFAKAIAEMELCPTVSKELTFLPDEKTGARGYRIVRAGRKITGIQLLYKWTVGVKSVSDMLTSDAMALVKRLEAKRVTTGKPLELNELEQLAEAYRVLDMEEKRVMVERGIAARKASVSAKQQEEMEREMREQEQLQQLVKELDRLASIAQGTNLDDY